MLNKIILTILLSVTFFLVQADTVEINPDHPDSYVVVKGDTLWDIAGRFLTQPWRWPDIWERNPQIENPHLIYPGDVVSLVYEDGAPILTVDRGGAGGSTTRRSSSGRNVKLSPEIRSHEREDAIPAIPIDAIRHFLSRPLVVDSNEMDAWPYVVSSYEQHLVSGEDNRVYVRGIAGNSDTHAWSVYRRGPAYTSMGKYGDDTLGYEAIYVGDAVIEQYGDPATALITNSDREILKGDRLAPMPEEEIETDFIPSPPARNVNGSIISVVEGVSQIGQYQIVVLDVGETDGLERGNVLGIFQSGQEIRDKVGTEDSHSALVEYLGSPEAAGEKVLLPDEYTGIIMIFRTFDRISYGLIMETFGPVHLNDIVKNL